MAGYLPGKGHTGIEYWGESIDKRVSHDNFFNGSITTQHTQGDPLISGYAFIIWLKMPTWMTAKFPNFGKMIEQGFKSVSGLENHTLETGEIGGGFSANTADFATTMSAKPKTISISHNEFSGSPYRTAYAYWVASIRDPETNVAVYAKREGIEYKTANHTGEFLYVTTRADADNFDADNIEFASYFTHVMPTVIPNDMYNYTSGEHNLGEFEQAFSVRQHTSPKIYEFAKSIIASKAYKFQHSYDFDPEVDNVLR